MRKKIAADPNLFAWAQRAEGDHVNDFKNWASTEGKAKAEEREIKLKFKVYWGEKSCEKKTADKVHDALRAGLRKSTKDTIKRWDKDPNPNKPGAIFPAHTWEVNGVPNPDRRP